MPDHQAPVQFPLDAPLNESLVRVFPGLDVGRLMSVLIEPELLTVQHLMHAPGRAIQTQSRRIRVRLPDFPAPPTTPTEKETH